MVSASKAPLNSGSLAPLLSPLEHRAPSLLQTFNLQPSTFPLPRAVSQNKKTFNFQFSTLALSAAEGFQPFPTLCLSTYSDQSA
jgi:hypothetical protein